MMRVALALIAFSCFFLPGCYAGTQNVPPKVGEVVLDDPQCVAPPQQVIGLPFIGEKDDGNGHSQALYGAKTEDGTMILILLDRAKCDVGWTLADSRVIEPECPPNECI